MKIWVDADACPKGVREILIRAGKKKKIIVTFISNQYHRLPDSPYIKSLQVPGGFDVADEHIVEQVQTGDLVITADIPLASLVIEKRAIALSPRGNKYHVENISNALTMRNLKQELRSTGMNTGGQQPFGNRDKEQFANQLDAILRRNS